MKNRFVKLVAVLMLLSSLVSCETKNAIVNVQSVSLSETEVDIFVGQTHALNAVIAPVNATDASVSWVSSNPDVATVDKSGVVTGVTEGDAIIKVTTTDGSKEAVCLVEVAEIEKSVEGVSIDIEEAVMHEDESLKLIATVLPEDASNKNVKWSSSDNEVAVVDNNGLVIARKPGEVTISVTTEDGGKTANSQISVVISVESISVDPTEATIFLGQTSLLTATILPQNATNQKISWTSSDESIATVDQTGLVTSVAVGSVTITVTAEDGDLTAASAITVINEDASMPDYIENGVNLGKGVKIGEQIWAPVNCGYEEGSFPYGKLYQWGSKFGLGYDSSEASYTVDSGNPTPDELQPNVYYSGYKAPNGTWGTVEPWDVKNEAYDPCPEGWRVPTIEEIEILITNHSEWIVLDDQNGYYFTGETPYAEAGGKQIFLPASGMIKNTSSNRGAWGYYHTASTYSSLSYYINFSADGVHHKLKNFKYVAKSVRCIAEPQE